MRLRAIQGPIEKRPMLLSQYLIRIAIFLILGAPIIVKVKILGLSLNFINILEYVIN